MPDPGGLPPQLQRLLRLVGGPRSILTPWRDLDLRRLWRTLLHAVLVGAVAGFVAVAFLFALEWSRWLLLEHGAGLQMPRPGAEVHLTPESTGGSTRWWLVALLPGIGGLACGLLTYFFAPEAAGPGGDAYVDSFHNRRGAVRPRVPFVKALASILTIGSGGSAGREGPTVQVSAGFGSMLASRLGLTDRERRILLVSGAAAGTGAMFRTPLGGALFAIEVLYREDFESDAIIPAVIASVTGYSIVTVIIGPGHVFHTAPSYEFVPAALPLYAAMALGLSLIGVVYVKIRLGMEDHFFAPLKLPQWSKPALGGLWLGVLALFVPQALGVGYGWVQGAIDGAAWFDPEQGYFLLFGLAGAKILAVGLTIGSGGSGGEMGPSLVIGGLAGGAFGLLFHQISPELAPNPGAFALVGMGAFFGGVANVPISSLIMTCEMASSYDLLAPLMLCEGITFLLLRRVTIYRRQARGRMDSPAHHDEVTVDILKSLEVADVYHPEIELERVTLGAPLQEIMRVMSDTSQPAVLVVGDDGVAKGMVTLETIQSTLGHESLATLAVAADVLAPTKELSPEDDLHAALHAFLVSGASVLPVVDRSSGEPRHIGVLTHADVDQAYEQNVAKRLARASTEQTERTLR